MSHRDDYDPITGVNQVVQGNADGSIVIGREQDIEPVLQANLDLRNMFDQRAGWKGDQHHVASIPDVVMEDLVRNGITQSDKAMRAWLNDPDNEMFRTRPGQV